MLELTLVRHGETAWNTERRYQGGSDVPLNDVGRVQAEQLAPRLQNIAFDAVYSSDLSRAMQTAQLALAERAALIRPEPRLREINFGKFEGLTYEEIKQQYPQELATWEQDRNMPTHGGESLDAVVARVRDFAAHLRGTHDTQHVLVVGHGGSLGILLALALDMPPGKWWQFRFKNAGISQVQWYDDNAALLLAHNDTYHLKA